MTNGEQVRECPVFGTQVTDVTDQIAATPCDEGGDYIALEAEDGCYYRVSRSLEAVLGEKPLSEPEKGRVREWLRRQRRREDQEGKCPKIVHDVLRDCGVTL